MSRKRKPDRLAIDGGKPVVSEPMPARGLLSDMEKRAVVRLFEKAIAAGQAIGYNGPEEEAYCREFSEQLGGGYADAVNSGTNAVYVALRALELPPFSEVIVPPITDPGGMMPVPLCNLIPVPADAAPGSFNTGPKQIEARLTPRTSAILIAHIGGEPADMGAVLRLARKRKLPVIEDCAQSHGALYRGKPVGTLGTLGAFSTMFGKHHCTGGQGGVVFTKDEALYWKVRQCADRGKAFGVDAPGNVLASLNMNLSEIGACIGRVQLKKLPRIVKRRRKVAAAVIEGIAGLQAVRVPKYVNGAEPSYWFLRLWLEADRLTVSKERFCEALAAEIGGGVTNEYRATPSTFPWFLERRVFGAPGLPWTAAEYKGDADAVHDIPNADASIVRSFRITVHEGMRASHGRKIAKALRKVEAAYLKE